MSDDGKAPASEHTARAYEHPRLEVGRRMGVGNINNEAPRVSRDPVTGEIRWEPLPE